MKETEMSGAYSMHEWWELHVDRCRKIYKEKTKCKI